MEAKEEKNKWKKAIEMKLRELHGKNYAQAIVEHAEELGFAGFEDMIREGLTLFLEDLGEINDEVERQTTEKRITVLNETIGHSKWVIEYHTKKIKDAKEVIVTCLKEWEDLRDPKSDEE